MKSILNTKRIKKQRVFDYHPNPEELNIFLEYSNVTGGVEDLDNGSCLYIGIIDLGYLAEDIDSEWGDEFPEAKDSILKLSNFCHKHDVDILRLH